MSGSMTRSSTMRNAADDGFEDFRPSNHDRALVLIGEFDLEAQLLAIRSLVHRNRQADEALKADIEDLAAAARDTRGPYVQYWDDQWVDILQGSVFQSAAHSMWALGMLAPFVESLFVSILSGLRLRGVANGNTSGPPMDTSLDHFWDPHYVKSNGEMSKGSLVEGIMRISNSTRLQAYFPHDLKAVLTALFAYRNKTFHHGFEWPEQERENFNDRIAKDGWTDWFSYSSHDHKPWIFYMRASFIEHCLTTIEKVLEGLGEFLENQPAAAPSQ